MTTTTTLADRVKAGAALLDDKRPGWWREIAVNRLSMGSCTNCILGQIYGHYHRGIFVLQLSDTMTDDNAVCKFGFDRDRSCEQDGVYWDARMAQFYQLADLWRAEIRTRLEDERGAE